MASRFTALVEVTLCSGFPTQVLIIVLLSSLGFQPQAEGGLSLGYVSALSILDAALLLGLIWVFVTQHGESHAAMFLGGRLVRREAIVGLLLLPIVFGIVLVVGWLILRYAPWLRDVPQNPLQSFLQTPAEVASFGVVVLAGALREEIQRAFVLRRFQTHLGGAALGLVVFSIVFGAGHTVQGTDAAVATAVLGAFWGVVYLARGSMVAPFVSHAAFNLVEVVRHGLS